MISFYEDAAGNLMERQEASRFLLDGPVGSEMHVAPIRVVNRDVMPPNSMVFIEKIGEKHYTLTAHKNSASYSVAIGDIEALNDADAILHSLSADAIISSLVESYQVLKFITDVSRDISNHPVGYHISSIVGYPPFLEDLKIKRTSRKTLCLFPHTIFEGTGNSQREAARDLLSKFQAHGQSFFREHDWFKVPPFVGDLSVDGPRCSRCGLPLDEDMVCTREQCKLKGEVQR